MRLVFGLFNATALLAILATTSGCPAPPRMCAGCTYKSATFVSVPITNVESASIKASVKHIGPCPQSRFPDGCTEVLSYNVQCGLGLATITLPMLIDAAPTNPNRGATLSVKLFGNPTPIVINGTVTSTSMSTLPATPCPPPTIDPYVTLPDVH